jgi:Ca-activated chloride channel family protein
MLYDWLKNIEFAYPFTFSLLIVLPVMIWRYAKRKNRSQASVTVSTAESFNVITYKNRLRHLPFVLRLLSISCLIVALARPQQHHSENEEKGEGIDIVLCMDVSGSMGSRDILPSRMEAAKEVAIDFVRNRPIDRIGLVIFSGESFTQVPLTTDRNTLISQIQSLESRKYLTDGTVIGEGLATAADRLSKSNATSKVIILLTDGKEDAPATRLIDPLTALEIAKSKGVKVYSIGMSAIQPADNLVVNESKPKKKAAGDYLDEQLLRRIAEETGGQYFRATNKEGLQRIYDQIDQLTKSKIEITSLKRSEEKFLPFVLAALGLLFIEILLRYTLLRKFP